MKRECLNRLWFKKDLLGFTSIGICQWSAGRSNFFFPAWLSDSEKLIMAVKCDKPVRNVFFAIFAKWVIWVLLWAEAVQRCLFPFLYCLTKSMKWLFPSSRIILGVLEERKSSGKVSSLYLRKLLKLSISMEWAVFLRRNREMKLESYDARVESLVKKTENFKLMWCKKLKS